MTISLPRNPRSSELCSAPDDVRDRVRIRRAEPFYTRGRKTSRVQCGALIASARKSTALSSLFPPSPSPTPSMNGECVRAVIIGASGVYRNRTNKNAVYTPNRVRLNISRYRESVGNIFDRHFKHTLVYIDLFIDMCSVPLLTLSLSFSGRKSRAESRQR